MPRLALGLLLAGLWLLGGCASLEGARLYTRGTRAMDEGRLAEAIAELEQSAALMPDSSPVQNHLGLAYARAGRDAEALAAFRRAVRLDCSNLAAVENLAAAERRLGLGSRPRDTAETSP
jgi:Flp pilus assembly protein TadD